MRRSMGPRRSYLMMDRILAEERSCLALYGDGYRDCTVRVPRYFLFF
jgi:protein-S-isoprenylcysteine O-methyltransferase Ste14